MAHAILAGVSATAACGLGVHACAQYDTSLLRYSDAGVDLPVEAPVVSEAEAAIDAEIEEADAPKDAQSETIADGDAPIDDVAVEDSPGVCSATRVDCDGDEANGCEAELTVDAKNCGSCAHDCIGGKCQAAHCLPVILASNQSVPSVLALDDDYVYWTNQGGLGAVSRIAKAGGTPHVVASTGVAPGGLAVDKVSVYWSDFAANGGVWRFDKAGVGDGGAPASLATGQASSGSLALDSVSVYWTTPTTVRRVPKSGGPVQNVASNQGQPGGLVSNMGWLFWTNINDGTVVGTEFAPAGIVVIAAGLSFPVGLADDIGNLYWTSYLGSSDGGTPRVMSIAKLNMTTPVVLADQQSGPLGVAAFGLHVYWTNNVGGTVMRVLKTGGPPETIATGQGAPAGIVADSKAIYWVNRDDGTLMAVARE